MAYEITWTDVLNTAVAEASSLGSLSNDQQTLILNQATRKVSEKRFDTDTFDARRYYASHLAVMAVTPSAGEGTLSSETIGDVSTSFTMAVNNPNPDQNILSTIYGRMYYELRRSNYTPFYVG